MSHVVNVNNSSLSQTNVMGAYVSTDSIGEHHRDIRVNIMKVSVQLGIAVFIRGRYVKKT